MTKLAAALLLGFATAGLAEAGPDDDAKAGPSLTVYSSADPSFDPQQYVTQSREGNPDWVRQVPGYGVVKEVRALDLVQGRNLVAFTDVAEFIDPTTVSFADLTRPAGTSVLEQSFRFDLASPDAILERYVDQEISHETTKDGAVLSTLTGRVLSVNQGQIVLQATDGTLRFLSSRDAGIRLPALPKGLVTKPTLSWLLEADQAGAHDVRTTYQTAGLTWRADYNVVLNGDSTKADVSAWMTLLNLSGASYPNARLKLVAGDVQRIQPSMPPAPMSAAADGALRKEGFQEKAFFEYHLYTLPRRTDVARNSTQQITLFPTASGVGVEKMLIYYGAPYAGWSFGPQPYTDRSIRTQANTKLDVYVRFRNDEASHMGMPLPKGKLRVYQMDADDGTLEFVGEDLIDHTAKDEEVLVRLGQSFDVVGDRVQTDFGVDSSRRTMVDSYRVVLRNHKPTPVRVRVKENLFRWTTWQVERTSDPFVKDDARTIHFDVEVPANGSKEVAYTARYTW